MSILVCGGADYIGAHVARLLRQCEDRAVVVDDPSTSNVARIGDTPLVRLGVAIDKARSVLSNLMVDGDAMAVTHSSVRGQVGESVTRPTWHHQQNIGGMANMLAVMGDADVNQMVFSSSVAVYGIPTVEVVTEDMAGYSINSYGETKLTGEWMMADCERAWDPKWIGLCCSNIAGAGWPDPTDPAIMNLIPMALDRTERDGSTKTFDTDYDTPGGTCVRDYIRVLDLTEAHIAAPDAFVEGRQPDHHTHNVGTGLGTSVCEIIDGLHRVTGWDFPVEELDRRAGDPPKLIDDPPSIGMDLSWKVNSGLDEILTSIRKGWQARLCPIAAPGS